MVRSHTDTPPEGHDDQAGESHTPEATQGEVLPPGSVKLSDGRVAVVKITDGPHDERVDMLLSRCGYTLTGMGALIYQRYRALLAVEFLDGGFQFFPKTKEQLQSRIAFSSKDIARITKVYDTLNGNDTADGDDEGSDFRN